MTSWRDSSLDALPPVLLTEAFPFHFVIGETLKLEEVGRSLAKIVPEARRGVAFGALFRLGAYEPDATFATLTADPNRLVVLDTVDERVRLRGQFVRLDGRSAVFLGSPWMTSIDQVSALGLQMSDFAVHDPILDFLQAVQHTHMTLSDVRQLADQLTRQNSALRETQTMLRAQQAETRKLAMVAARSDNAVILTDARGCVQWVNAGFTRLTGYELQEVLGKTPGSMLQGPRTDAETVGRIRRDLASGRGFTAELVNYAKSGREYWVHFEVQPISEDGVLTGYMAIESDTTELRERQDRADRLAKLNEISREVISSFLKQDDLSNSIHLILERVGRFLNVSRSYLFRYRERGDVLFNTHEWCAPEVVPQRDQLQNLPSSMFPWWTEELRTEGIIMANDVERSALPAEVKEILDPQEIKAILVLPIFIGDRLEGFIGFDETRGPRAWLDEEVVILRTMVESLSRSIERRVASRKLQATAEQLEAALERAERASNYKSEFLANMSHEIRTPMTAIVGYSEMLVRPKQSESDHREWAKQIHRSSEHLLSILNDILDLSKIEAGKLELSTQSCQPFSVIEQVRGLMQPTAQEKLLAIRTVYDGPQPKSIQTDAVRLRQIILNLVSNAIKFTDRGSVTIRSRVVESAAGARFSIRVEDTGIGIPADKVEVIFSPFVQLNVGNTRKYGGTGLGLDICARLARLLGGTLTVESTVGVGSVFALELPLAAGDAVECVAVEELHQVAPTVRQVPPPALGGRSVLIVDDNPDNRRIIDFLLRDTGATTLLAVNGFEALRQIERAADAGNVIDLILMDMHMPVMDGYEAATELKRRGVGIPVVALTAAAMAGDEKRCLAAGCDAFVPKPVVPGELYRTISSLLSGPATGAKAQGAAKAQEAAKVPQAFNDPAFNELVKKYLRNLRVMSVQLEDAARAGDVVTARSLVHRLAGTGTNFGFPAITSAARQCEAQLAEAGVTELRAVLAPVFASVEEAVRSEGSK